MSRPKKINDTNRQQIAEALKTKSRSQICQDFGVTFVMLRREFGKAWTKGNSEIPREVPEVVDKLN